MQQRVMRVYRFPDEKNDKVPVDDQCKSKFRVLDKHKENQNSDKPQRCVLKVEAD